MKRTEHATSCASSWKRCSASGSRSIATSVPEEPKRSASRRAWPPSPKVQSIAVCPGCGSSSANSSAASTGVWPLQPACWPLWGRSVLASCLAPEADDRPRGGRRCERLMSSSVVDMRGDLRDAAEQRRSVGVPGVLAPKLQPLAGPDDDDLLVQLGVL